MKPTLITENFAIRFSDLEKKLQNNIEIAPEVLNNVRSNREFLLKKVSDGQTIYGVNTGFGALADKKVSDSELEQLQLNLIRSHACGTGNPIPEQHVKAMLFFKIISLCKAYSGVSTELIERLTYFYNQNLLPEVFEFGSLGASGDLAPLAHLCLPVIGEGNFRINGLVHPASEILKQHQLKPLTLGAKEGIALLNGTQFMQAYAWEILHSAKHLLYAANQISSLSCEAFKTKQEFLHPTVHKIRNQNGQIWAANELNQLLNDSQLVSNHNPQVQDPYSFRCIPQVHGASYDVFQSVIQIFEREWNAVTDNPNVIQEEDKVISAGNFHGQVLALYLDHLKLAIHELGNISERRIYKLLTGQQGLPKFLSNNPGLESGLMIAQYSAAGLVSHTKQLCTPASADSIVSSNGQEDHVSMGANAGVQCYELLQHTKQIIAIELLTASEAIKYRNTTQLCLSNQKLLGEFKKVVPNYHTDTVLHPDFVKSKAFIENYLWDYSVSI